MTLTKLAELVCAEPPVEAVGVEIVRVSGFDSADGSAVVFALDAATLDRALMCGAGAILAPLDSSAEDARVLRVRNPKYAFSLCGRALKSAATGEAVHATAVFDPSARIGVRTRVGAGAVLEQNVVVGADCVIGNRVTVCAGTELGDRVVVQPGAVLGSTGFGYVRDPATGEYLLFPQEGTLVVESDVEIGANTTIDRGALGETRIGRGTKIDNQVHIGHNCRIGRNVILAAQVGISGSCVVGDGAVLAGQVGLGDHVTIGPGVILGGASGVFPHKQLEGPGEMFMGVPAEPVKKYLKTLAKTRRL